MTPAQVASLVPFYAVVVAPLAALLAGLLGSLAVIYRLGEKRLVILVGILLLMSQHQMLELLTFLRTGRLMEPFVPELIETGANLLTAGSVYYVLLFLQNERDLAEDLERSRERYSGLVENSPAPILVQADDGVRYANPAATDLLGCEPEQLRGRDLLRFVADGDRPGVARLLRRLFEGDAATESPADRFRLFDDDGEVHHVEATMTRITYGGEPAVQLFLHDRTAREEYERQLTRTNERLATIFQNVNDALIVLDPEADEIVEANRSACEITGYERHELIGLSPREIHPHDIDRFESFVEDVRTGRQERGHRLSCHRKDGRTVPAEVSATAIELDGRSRILAAIRDVSDREKQERWGTILDRTLRHNLRTEINVIAGFADDIAGELDDDRLADRAAAIREKAMRLVDIGDNIRRLQRVIDGGEDPSEAPDLTGAVRAVVEEARAEYPGADIRLDLPAGPTVRASDAIERALWELVENAVEHNDAPTPAVTVSVRRDGPEAYVVRIADNGPGVPEQDRAVVTGEREITPLRHGSGLGLWIAAWTVEAFGGRLAIEDNEPTGSVVSLHLQGPQVGGDVETADLRIVGTS